MFEDNRRYQTYLLTIWEERSPNPNSFPSWRFSLENTSNGKRRGFASLDTLFRALRVEVEQGLERLGGDQAG